MWTRSPLFWAVQLNSPFLSSIHSFKHCRCKCFISIAPAFFGNTCICRSKFEWWFRCYWSFYVSSLTNKYTTVGYKKCLVSAKDCISYSAGYSWDAINYTWNKNWISCIFKQNSKFIVSYDVFSCTGHWCRVFRSCCSSILRFRPFSLFW
jgi:hypothetical protein